MNLSAFSAFSAAVLACAACLTAVGITNDAPIIATDIADRTDMDTLFECLGGANWNTREDSQLKLIALGTNNPLPILESALRRYLSESDPEVKCRLEEVMRGIVLHDFDPRAAFLGVQLGQAFQKDKNGLFPVPIHGIVMNTVASSNDFRTGDSIMQADDHICNGNFNTDALIRYISSQKPGYRMTFVLSREGNIITNTVALGARDDQYMRQPFTILPTVRNPGIYFKNWLTVNSMRMERLIAAEAEASAGGRKSSKNKNAGKKNKSPAL